MSRSIRARYFTVRRTCVWIVFSYARLYLQLTFRVLTSLRFLANWITREARLQTDTYLILQRPNI